MLSRRRLAVGLGLSIVLLPVLLFLALHLPVVQRALVLRVLDDLRTSSDLDVAFRSVRVSPTRLAVVVDGLRVATLTSPQQPLLVADRAELDVARVTLTSLGRDIAFQRVVLDGPVVTLRRGPDGYWNLPRTTDADETTRPAVTLGEVQIHDGRLVIDDALAGQRVALTSVEVATRGAGVFATGADAEVQIGDTTFAGRLAGDLGYDHDVVSLRNARVQLAQSQVTGSGSYDLRSGGIAVDATLALVAADAAPLAGVPGLAGTIAGTMQVAGTIESPTATWTLDGKGLTDGTLPPSVLTAAGHADRSGVQLRTATVETAGGRISATGRVGVAGDTATSLRLTARGLQAGELLRAYALEVPVVTVVGGRVSFDGPGLDWRRWTSVADLQLRAPVAARPGQLPVDGVARVRLADGRWSLDTNLASPATAVVVATLDGRLAADAASSSVRGNVRVDLDDLAESVRRVTGTALDVAGRASIDARVTGTLSAPRAAWTLDGTAATSALAPILVVGGGTATVDTLRASALTLTSGPNTMTADATVGLAGARRLSGSFTATLPDLAALFADPAAFGWPLSGSGHARGALGGTLSAASVRGGVTLSDVAFAGQRIDQASADVTVRGTRLLAERLDARVGDARLSGSVAADLTQATHRASLVVENWPIHPIPAGGAVAAVPVAAMVSGAIETTGPWQRPSGTVALDARDATWQGHPLSTLSLRGRADGNLVDLTFDAPQWRTTGRGEVRFVDGYPFDVDATADALTLEPFRPWLPDALQKATATVSAGVTVTGRATDAAASAVATARLQALSLDMDDARLTLERPAVVRASRHVVGVDDLLLRTGELTARVTGEIGRTPSSMPLTLAVTGAAQALAPWLRALAIQVPQVDGALDLQATVAGTVDAPRPSARLVATDVTVVLEDTAAVTARAPAVRLPRLQVTLDEGVISLEPLLAQWQDARVTASGRVPLGVLRPHVAPAWHAWLGDAAGPARLSVRGEGLDTHLLTPFVAADALEGISGTVTAALEMEAVEATWAGVTGVLTLDTAAFTIAGVPLTQARPTVIRLEAGHVRVRDVLFSGPNTDLSLDGEADISADVPTFDVQLRGLTDLAILRPFLSGAVPGGRAEIDLHASGSMSAPTVTGDLLLTDASLRIAEPRLVVEQLNGSATFTGRQMAMPALRGLANGSPATLSAALVLGTDNTVGGQVRLRAAGLPLEYPEGLRTEADVDLLASVVGRRVDVTGTVDVLRGTYRDPIALSALTSGLLASASDAALVLDEELPLDVRFDVQVQTRDDIVVDNNYGRFAAGGAVQLLGTMDSPGLSGRITLREGGELYLSGLTYRIERGALDFANPTRIEPIVDLAAETQARGERIRIEASGTPETLEVTLSAPDADVAPSQADLASLLVSGRSLDELTGAAAGEQALGLLSADLLGVVGRGVGLDAMRLDRDLLFDERSGTGEIDLAGETDPVARLTLAKRLRSNVEVTFSQNLRNASEITWLVSWRPFRRVEARLLQRDDRSTAYEFRHEVVFGAPPAPPRTRDTPVRVREVEVVSSDPALTATLERRLKLDPGDRFDFYRWQSERDRLDAWLQEQRYVEHRLVARRTPADGEDGPVVDLRYEITPGPRATLEVVGASLDADVVARMHDAWQGSVFDGFLQDDLSRLAREAMVQRGHPLATATASTTLSADGREKTATVSVTPGPQVGRRLEVAGLDGSLGRRFEAWLASGADRLAWLDPPAFRSAARSWLRSRGALDAEVALAQPVLVDDIAVRTVRVDHATPYRLGRITTAGIPEVRATSVRDQLGLTPDESFDALEVNLAVRGVERWYVAEGFRQASVDVGTTVRREAQAVDVDISVAEGPRAIVVDTAVEGGRRTRGALLDRALALPVGTIATPQALLAARKRLYDTGVLSSADVEARPAGPPVETADGTVEQPVRVVGTVTEQPRLRLRYGLAINDDVLQEDVLRVTESRRVTPGLSALLENRNLFGRAVTGGLSARYERTRQSGRAFLTSPFLFGRDLQVQLSSGLTRSRLVPDLKDGPLDIRTDATVGLTQRLPGLEGLRLTYGYRYERSRTYDPQNPELFDIRLAAPRLTSTVFIDRRDDAAAATRGWFHASTVEVTRSWLGSDYEFVTYYGQQSAFTSFGRLVLAGRAQVGLGRGFAGQNLLATERFEAGGASSVRGYRESIIGEYDEILEIARGDGLLVLNGELRMPLWRWISGVAFVDGGGVFARVSDFGVRQLQWGTGAGVRVSTPAGLVRVDLGLPLDRRAIDKSWRVYVGLGHIF